VAVHESKACPELVSLMLVMMMDESDFMGTPSALYAPGMDDVNVILGSGVLVAGSRVAVAVGCSTVAVAGMGVAVTTITMGVDVIAMV